MLKTNRLKVGTYILNTMPSNHRWHNLAMKSFHDYFSRFDIKINVLDDKHYLVRQMMQHEDIHALLRKALRWYDFLDSDNDYGLFLDLDTVILSKSKDVRDYCRGENYITWMKGFEDGKLPKRWVSIKNREFTLVRKFMLEELWRRNPSMSKDCLKFNTGFSLLNRSFVESLVQGMGKLGFDLSKNTGLENLKEFQLSANKLIPKDCTSTLNPAGYVGECEIKRKFEKVHIHDEHIMELSIPFDDVNKLNLASDESFQDLAVHSYTVSYKTDQISEDHTGRPFDLLNYDITKFCKYYKKAIFFHLQVPHKDETMLRYMEMFG